MAVIEFIPERNQSHCAMKNLIQYCLQEAKVADRETNRRLVSGINCDGENAYKEFMTTKTAYKKTDGINFYQYVQSFSPDENITAEQVHQIGLEFASKAWEGFEVLVATHTDVGHLHNHFVINSVGFEDGYKLRQNPNTLKTLRELSDRICEKHNLSVLKPYEKDGLRLSSREYRVASKSQSWKFRLMSDIDSAMNKSGSKADFIREMNRLGYKITWTDERKYITFTCPNGMKCRDIKLHDKKYLKEVLNYELQFREQITKRYNIGELNPEELLRIAEDGRIFEPTRDMRNRQDLGRGDEGTFGEHQGVSTQPLQSDKTVGDQTTAGGFHRPGGESGNNQDGFHLDEDDRIQQQNGGGDAVIDTTGWEESRGIYFQMLTNVRATHQRNEQGHAEHTKTNDHNDDNQLGVVGGAVGLGLRGALGLGSIISDDTEDEEEKRKRLEAEESASNLGALIGLGLGLLSPNQDETEDENTDEDPDEDIDFKF